MNSAIRILSQFSVYTIPIAAKQRKWWWPGLRFGHLTETLDTQRKPVNSAWVPSQILTDLMLMPGIIFRISCTRASWMCPTLASHFAKSTHAFDTTKGSHVVHDGSWHQTSQHPQTAPSLFRFCCKGVWLAEVSGKQKQVVFLAPAWREHQESHESGHLIRRKPWRRTKFKCAAHWFSTSFNTLFCRWLTCQE